jgi:hypothetical protein
MPSLLADGCRVLVPSQDLGLKHQVAVILSYITMSSLSLSNSLLSDSASTRLGAQALEPF